MIQDSAVYPVLVELSACLCKQVEESGLPGFCYCGPIAGELVLDWCGGDCQNGGGCGGQAWVRFVNAFLSDQFPDPSTALANCRAPIAFNLEIGTARCAPLGTANQASGYTPPTMQQYTDALTLQMADMAMMRRAINCCFGTGDRDYIVGSYEQISVNGGDCLGGTFQVTVWETF